MKEATPAIMQVDINPNPKLRASLKLATWDFARDFYCKKR